MNLEELAALHAKSLAEIEQAETPAALEQIRIRYLGRNGLLPAVMKQLKDVPADERPAFGRQANAWRQALDAALSMRGEALGVRGKIRPSTPPCRWPPTGAQHPSRRHRRGRLHPDARFHCRRSAFIETRFNNFTTHTAA